MDKKKKKRISEIVEKFLEIEKKKKLFELKINDIYIWKILRFPLENEIQRYFFKYSNISDIKKKDKILILKKIFYNFKKINKKEKNIFFISNRFFKDEDQYKEIYTYSLYEKMENVEIVYPDSCSIEFVNKKYDYSFIENLDYIILKFKKKLFSNFFKFKKLENKMINDLKKEMENFFLIENLNTLEIKNIKEMLYSFKLEKEYYLKLLKKKKPKKIYIVCSYGKESLILAAQILGINVIEIQHGGIDKYHTGYHFPTEKKIPYFPNEMLMFGEYWYQNSKIPLKLSNVKFIGYPYLKKQFDKYKEKIREKDNQILFISQGTLGKEITKQAVQFAKENLNKTIVIRLHPSEFLRWKQEYEVLYNNRNLPNLIISDNNNKNLYEYLFESKYIICVYSTVIYEALYLKKKIGILNLPGIEYIEDLLNKRLVYKFEDKIDIKKLEEILTIPSNYYFNN